ncbi:MAG: 50S ribosomal protein L5 [Candidatus Rehaiarchaeum fermentans]|nr:50S ribosomal protein L5 [Candidatus Rehaiarchaeum fermentans]MCW1311227.1 50S ribosomal protein L5 [Candidatus Rehaiarchaeum fermentans]
MNENPNREILIDKLVLNIGVGTDEEKMEKAKLLLSRLTNAKVVETEAKKRIEEWKVRKGLKIGVAVTLRKEKAIEMFRRILKAVDNKVKSKSIGNGTVSIGIPEYIYIEGAQYDPKIGIMGLSAHLKLKRRGFRVQYKKRGRSKIGKNHLISKEETIEYLKNKFNIKIE